jgi:aminopeptidase-like protein
MLVALGKILEKQRLRHSVRMVFAPATIGSIAWLAANESGLSNIKAGLVASVLGDNGHFRYKLSRYGDSLVDRACRHVLSHANVKYEIREFSPWGYDERQFCSPGINLPVGRLTRSPNGEYPEYHTSADNLRLIHPDRLAESMLMYLRVIACLESNRTFLNREPRCEPQLGRRGLYRTLGGFQDIEDAKLAMLWLLNQSDGSQSLLDIAERSGLSHVVLDQASRPLLEHGLLQVVN